MFMELTCLSRGSGIHFPPCYVLDVCGIRILIDCPIDLSALAIFSPLHQESHAVEDEVNLDCLVNKSTEPGSPDLKRQKLEKHLNADALIRAEPWYKTVTNLHLWNIAFIDVVLISSPSAMLGLPFLTRHNGFSAKIYVTEAAAKLGKLMMDNLVAMHTEYRQFYGPEEAGVPQWMNWEELESLPSALREIVLGTDGIELGGWMQLYSAADVEDSVKELHTLKYGEEVCYNGAIVLIASSSGLEIGACNWTIKCPNTSIACISNSVFGSAHALEFDYHAVQGNDVVIYADNSFTSILEHADIDSSSTATNISLSLSVFYSSGGEDILLGIDETKEERENLDYICTRVIASVKAGGSVLIPVDRLGMILQLMEQLLVRLENSDVKVPVYVLSYVAEEILAFTNIIPEWLCKQRQGRLFSGEPLFGHVELVKEGKIQVHREIYSPKLLANWQEPAIVFCPHWNLRLGPAVHLLRRWHGDQNSLLVLEDEVDSGIALLPFSTTMKMEVHRCSFLSGIKLKKVQPLLGTLQPKLVLLPEDLSKRMRCSDANSFSVIHYSVNETVQIPSPDDGLDLDIAPEVIPQLQWRSLREENLSIARLKGKLAMRNGKHLIFPRDELAHPKSEPLLHWGSPDLQRLLTSLSEMGVSGSLLENSGNKERGTATASIVHIQEPNKALVEVRETGTTIITSDKKLASLIFEAVSCVLDGV
ncbi:integrator complex subunit 9 homolog isoform X1 [Punica granatum]|uniref:Integrator complex subunit 9 homolog isoform X1 n=1 Tax=Punica granatum TaxID=22663 RepID=A0A6P8C2F4_PUNGR|nr:integrator complex subunit 9 homolog isoform X1 [Punica granatum]